MNQNLTFFLTVGKFVQHPDKPEWGVGQVQSVIDLMVTVNFEHTGKVVINGTIVALEILDI